MSSASSPLIWPTRPLAASPSQVAAVVEYLCHDIPRELLALELEDHQTTVFINAKEVNVSGLDRNLSAHERESAHQDVGVCHENGFQHLFRLNPLSEVQLGSGPGCPVDFPDYDLCLHTILSNMSHSPLTCPQERYGQVPICV